MPKAILILLFLNFCSIISSITSIFEYAPSPEELWAHPPPSPDFVSGFDNESRLIAGENQVCALINSAALWRLGNEANELNEHITSELQFIVDGQVIRSEDVFITIFLLGGTKSDPSGFGLVLGTVGWPILTCFDTESLSAGLHTATVQTTTTFGEVYSYTWAFSIPED